MIVALIIATIETARGDIVAGEIFLQGDFVEVGIHQAGSFGTVAAAPSGYHPLNRTNLGFVSDFQKDGWATGTPPQSGDYFLPGAPAEGWLVEWTVGGSDRTFKNFGAEGSFQVPKTSLTETSSGGTQSAVWDGTAINGSEKLRIVQTVSFDTDDLFFKIKVDMTNTGSTPLESLEYLRSVDPDNDRDLTGGQFETSNFVKYQPGVGGNADKALIVAKGTVFPAVTLALGTIDSRAIVSFEGFSPTDPDAILDSPVAPTEASPVVGDQAVNLAYRLGTLAPGESVTIAYAYNLHEDDLETALSEVAEILAPVIPSVSKWGLVIMVGAFAILLVAMVRRQRRALKHRA